MKLVERNDVVKHILAKMEQVVDQGLISDMVSTIFRLGFEYATNSYANEEDARENPLKASYQFLFQKFVRYAILSHTWLPTGEIIYQNTLQKDWLSVEGPGINKLKGFCEVAHRDHDITLAWIDTLCINKESSAELDESIQSMYKWYQNSSICITYLCDTISLKGMKSDTWFRRGWTLQELIAPKNMQFYGRGWVRLTSGVDSNDKASPEIQQIVYKVTQIKAEEFVSFDPLTGSDLPTRMRWAASRKTTRGEDRAYSLMGIFGVNFSISYGEGAERAFFRLIEAIISSRDTSYVIQILDWAGKAISNKIHTSCLIPSGPECYNVPLESTTYFPTLVEPMALTHLGLRVRLLLSVIPVNTIHIRGLVPISGPQIGPFDIRLRITRNNDTEPITAILANRFSNIPTTVSELLPFNPYSKRAMSKVGSIDSLPTQDERTFLFGIYTFEEDDDEGCVYIPFTAHAFLLGIPTPHRKTEGFSSKDFGPTSKIDTREVIELKNGDFSKAPEPSDIAQGFITIKQEALEGMGMGLISAYL